MVRGRQEESVGGGGAQANKCDDGDDKQSWQVTWDHHAQWRRFEFMYNIPKNMNDRLLTGVSLLTWCVVHLICVCVSSCISLYFDIDLCQWIYQWLPDLHHFKKVHMTTWPGTSYLPGLPPPPSTTLTTAPVPSYNWACSLQFKCSTYENVFFFSAALLPMWISGAYIKLA